MNVGCYASTSGCYYSDVFVESLTSSQASTAAASFSPTMTACVGGCASCSRYAFYSTTTMTVEKCLQACITTYGFKYGGVQE